jgi:hypothetical protein
MRTRITFVAEVEDGFMMGLAVQGWLFHDRHKYGI